MVTTIIVRSARAGQPGSGRVGRVGEARRLSDNLGALALRLTDVERAALGRALGPAAIAGARFPAAQMGLVAR
jgi:hypothetical protein